MLLGIKNYDELKKKENRPLHPQVVEWFKFGPPQNADYDEELALRLGFNKFDDHANKDISQRSHSDNNSKSK